MIERTSGRIFRGDARDLSALNDGEIDLIVSSPPYWQIKDYGAQSQIGYGQSLHEYLFDLARLTRVFPRFAPWKAIVHQHRRPVRARRSLWLLQSHSAALRSDCDGFGEWLRLSRQHYLAKENHA